MLFWPLVQRIRVRKIGIRVRKIGILVILWLKQLTLPSIQTGNPDNLFGLFTKESKASEELLKQFIVNTLE